MTESSQSDDHESELVARPQHVAIDRPEESRTARNWMFLLRYAAPALAALALVLVMAGEQAGLDEELHLIIPARAVPGQRLPVRALLYTQLRATEGPSLHAQPVDVALETSSGRVVSHSRLSVSRAGTADCEGELSIPEQAGVLRVRALTYVEDRAVRAQTQLIVAELAPAPPPEGRSLRALQQFAEGAVIAEPGALAPASLRVRVAGGACVPELPCRAFVHVGEPAASIRVEANSALTPAPATSRASAATSGVVELSFVTHGPEAELWLIAERAGQRVARRAVRLPIAMAASAVQTSALLYAADETPHLRVPGAEEGCIVDAFSAGHWLRTGSLSRCDRDNALPFSALPPGIHRLQVRRDPFSAQSAGVASVVVRAPGETPAHSVTALAHAAEQLDAQDPVVQACLRDAACADDSAAPGYLAALLEAGVIEPPRAVTGYAESLAQLRERQGRLRNLSLLALGLGAISLVLSIGRRGLRAGARASDLLGRESLDPAFGRRARVRSLLLVLASMLSLALVFVVIALYVLARGGY
jgi:hypothetical protein